MLVLSCYKNTGCGLTNVICCSPLFLISLDNRLENSDRHRGCGGVAILWNKSINATTVTIPGNSDRICGVTIHLSKTTDQSNTMSTINIFNVYFPSGNHNRDDFMLCSLNLEETINSLPSQDIPILIAGDFNAHLGTLARVF